MGWASKIKKAVKKTKAAVAGASKVVSGAAQVAGKTSQITNKALTSVQPYVQGVPIISTAVNAGVKGTALAQAQAKIVEAAADRANSLTSGKSSRGGAPTSGTGYTTVKYVTTPSGLVPQVQGATEVVDTTKNYLLFGLMAAVLVFTMKK